MKKAFICALFALSAICVHSQGRSISLQKKITEPYITENSDTLAVGSIIQLLPCDGVEYRFVQLLNGYNEPVKPASSNVAMKKQPILFFKEQDGVTYAFTKYFCINIDAAIYAKEIRWIK